MVVLLRWVVWGVAWVVLRLRYRVDTTGMDKVRGLRKAIILPNHPAYIDPLLVLTVLWPLLRPRPMLFAGLFRNPLLFWLPKLLGAAQIPDLEQQSAQARRQAADAIKVVIAGLNAGDNHILWPAGHVYHANHESLGAARSLAEVIGAVPDAQIVVVRTRGLWGSMFSFARTGRRPNLLAVTLKGAGILLANLVVFAPRRRVSITVDVIDRASLPGLAREQLNPFFEAWYNAPGPETPTHVPYHFLSRGGAFRFPEAVGKTEADLTGITPQTKQQVAQFIAEKLKREPLTGDEEPSAKLEELGLDSLDRMELSLEVERRFGFAGATVPITIGDLWALAEGRLQGTLGTPSPAPREWFAAPPPGERIAVLADTIPQAFVRRAMASAGAVTAADELSGAVSYRRLLVASILMSRRLRRLPGPSVGIMLPASVGTGVLFFAAHLAGKLPVLLNWTTGPANLAHAARLMGLSHVVTSRRFIDRTAVAVEGAQYVFVEDLRGAIGKLEMLLALMRVRVLPGGVLRETPMPQPDSPAVVLFTSGSEKAPKAVPLTHRNLISNITASLDAFELVSSDVLVGFLPAFHSFGLTVTTVLPMLSGLRVVYHADPTDASGIARKIGSYQGTVICGTPTFVSHILQRGKPQDLGTVRIAVAGAEKAPPSLYELAARAVPSGKLLEGYGITECSPVVSCNRLASSKPGSIGLPLPGVTVQVVDVEDGHGPLPPGEMGMLLVSGPSVFPGYIGEEAGSPFVEQDGRRWYVTGDLAKIDADGFLWFCGRLKRFLKAGGEMISLPAIEEPLARGYPATDEGPRVAVEGVETPEGRRIVLFTTETLSVRQANEILQKEGLRGILRIDEVRRVEKIPVLGTGKTDYKVLRGWIQSAAEKGEPQMDAGPAPAVNN